MAMPDEIGALVRQVCADERRREPRVIWRSRRADPWRGTSGTTWDSDGRITILAGTDPRYWRLVVLHELAHSLSPRGWHHNVRFWQRAWSFYTTYLPEDEWGHAFESERRYRLKAIRTAPGEVLDRWLAEYHPDVLVAC